MATVAGCRFEVCFLVRAASFVRSCNLRRSATRCASCVRFLVPAATLTSPSCPPVLQRNLAKEGGAAFNYAGLIVRLASTVCTSAAAFSSAGFV